MPLRIGLTIGDPGGIGPEVALKALADLAGGEDGAAWGGVEFYLIGPGGLWAHWADAIAEKAPAFAAPIRRALERTVILGSEDPRKGAMPIVGRTNERHGRVAAAAIEKAVALWKGGHLDAIVTAPLSKEGLAAAGVGYPGHTEMLRDLSGAPDVAMLLVGGGLRVGLVSIHVALRTAISSLSQEGLLAKARLMDGFLTQWLGQRPRLGICGLNPHAGEGGLFGDEEDRVIRPALERGRTEGMLLDGPHPADTIYKDMLEGRFDGILAMYHDQGLIPVKTLAFDTGVNVSMGLPLIRTSPDHGTAFGIAGEGIARHESMKAAIALAAELVAARQGFRT